MTIDNIINLSVNACVIIGSTGLAYNRLTNRMSIVETKLEALKDEIHDNGFVRKDRADSLQSQIDDLKPTSRRRK